MAVGALSIGNRQRVEIAKALSRDARLLIMDEPTAALTEADVERLFGIVRRLRERGVGAVYISHRLEEVFELADRVTVLRDGKYVATKPVAETDKDDLINMMVGRTIDALFPKADAKLGEIALQVKGLNRRPLTNDISFHVRAGEIVGLAGLVGSGRSELAHVIFGVTPAETGEIRINGTPVTIKSPRQAKSLGIAYVPEDRGHQGLIRPMKLRENVSLAVLERLVKGVFVDRQAEDALADQSIQKARDHRASGTEQVVNKLSGGNQQKVVLSKWLASEPLLLVMDEPTRGVDVGGQGGDPPPALRAGTSRGWRILMISSELPEVLGMSDRILVMRNSQLVAEFERDAEATQENVVASAMMSGTHIAANALPTAAVDAGAWGMTAAASTTGNTGMLQNARRLVKAFAGQELILLLIHASCSSSCVGLYQPALSSTSAISDQYVFNANAYIAVAAIGISMIIITGNIDISVRRRRSAVLCVAQRAPSPRCSVPLAGPPRSSLALAWIVPHLRRCMLISADQRLLRGLSSGYPPSWSRWARSASSERRAHLRHGRRQHHHPTARTAIGIAQQSIGRSACRMSIYRHDRPHHRGLRLDALEP